MTHETFVSKKNLQDVLDGIETKIAGLGSTLTGIYTWQPNNQYKTGDVVITGGSLFICSTTHTSSLTFMADVSNWLLFFADIGPWITGTYYVVDACVISNNKLYQCNTAHTAGATFDAAEEANWTLIGGGSSIGLWQASTAYAVGDLAIESNKLYRCKTAHTSGSTFDATEQANWNVISGGNASIADWVASTSYAVGDMVIYQNSIYKCITANSDATFTGSNWVEIGGANLNVRQSVLLNTDSNACVTGATFTLADTYTNYDEITLTCGFESTTIIPSIQSQVNIAYTENDTTYKLIVVILFTGNTANVYFASYGTAYTSSAPANIYVVGKKYYQSSGDIDLWQANTSYSVGNLVIYNNKLYRCTTANADATWTDANWQEVGGGTTINDWVASTSYAVGDLVLKANRLYQCNTANNDATWQQAKWTAIGTANVQVSSRILWSGLANTVTTGDVLTLADNYANYEEIMIVSGAAIQNTFKPSLGNGVLAQSDGGILGSTFANVYLLSPFVGNTVTVASWSYGSNIANVEVQIVGRNYTQMTEVLWSGGSASQATGNVLNLSNAYTDYEKIRVYLGDSDSIILINEMNPTTEDKIVMNYQDASTGNSSQFITRLIFSGATATLEFVARGSNNQCYIKRIEGTKTAPISGVSDMTGATSTTDGKHGLVVKPSAGDQNKYLRGDGTWGVPSITELAVKTDILWQGGSMSQATGDTITLAYPYTDYDKIKVYLGDANAVTAVTEFVPSKETETFVTDGIESNQHSYNYLQFSGTTMTFGFVSHGSSSSTYIKRVEGLKYVTTAGSVNDFTGATSTTAGAHGLVPQPLSADKDKFLKGDGTWALAGGTALNMSRIELWSGKKYTNNDVMNLVDTYTNYDYILVYLGMDETSGHQNYGTAIMCPAHEQATCVTGSLNYLSWSIFSAYIAFSGATATLNLAYNLTSNVYIYRIEGLKLYNPHTYSTTEKVIGTWVNGKPLYQITLTGNMPSSGSSLALNIVSLNIEDAVEVNGFFTVGTHVKFPINYYYNSTNWSDALVGYDTTTSNKRIFFNWGTAITPTVSDTYNITLRYTKT